MPKSKKPRKPKTAVKHSKGPKDEHAAESWSFTQKQHEQGHKSNVTVQTPMHNRQPPKHGS